MPPRPVLLPGPVDDILPLAAQFGRNLKRIFDPQGFKREEITQGILAGEIDAAPFAQAAESGDSEVMRQVLMSMGLNPDDKTNIEFGTATGAARPLPFEKRVEGKLGPEDVELGADVTRARFRGEIAESEAGEAEADVRKVAATDALVRSIPQLENSLRVASANAAIAGIEFKTEHMEAYRTWVASLPPALQGRAAAAIANPEFLRDLQHMENLNVEQLKILARNAATAQAAEAARFAMFVKLQDQIVPLAKRMFEKDVADEELEAITPVMQNLLEIQMTEFPEFRSSTVEMQRKLFGGVKIEITPVDAPEDQLLIDGVVETSLGRGKEWKARLHEEDAKRRAEGQPEIIPRLQELGRWEEIQKKVDEELSQVGREPVGREGTVAAISATTGISSENINSTIEAMAALGSEFAARFVGVAEWISAGGVGQYGREDVTSVLTPGAPGGFAPGRPRTRGVGP